MFGSHPLAVEHQEGPVCGPEEVESPEAGIAVTKETWEAPLGSPQCMLSPQGALSPPYHLCFHSLMIYYYMGLQSGQFSSKVLHPQLCATALPLPE